MPKLKDGEYDALIMTSCMFIAGIFLAALICDFLFAGDEGWVQPQLLEFLETADIPIICLHHEMWSFWKHRPRLLRSAQAGKLTFLTLGEHVRTLVTDENTLPWTEDGEDRFKWTDVPSEVFIPVSNNLAPRRAAESLISWTLGVSSSCKYSTSVSGTEGYPAQ